MQDKTIATRVPAEMAHALERMAAKEDRTVAAELRRAVRQHVGTEKATQHAPRQSGGAA